MSKKGSSELFTDFKDTLKLRYSNRIKEIKHIFAVLNIKSECYHEFRLLQNCTSLLMRNGAVSVDRMYLLILCTKRMLEQTVEVDLSKKLYLIITDLENLLNYSSGLLRQLRSDMRHYKNTLGMLTTQSEEKKPKEKQGNVEQLDNHNSPAHKKILQLKQEISLKRSAMKKLRTYISKYEGLPPDIKLAKKMIEEQILKLDKLSNDLELAYCPPMLERFKLVLKLSNKKEACLIRQRKCQLIIDGIPV